MCCVDVFIIAFRSSAKVSNSGAIRRQNRKQIPYLSPRKKESVHGTLFALVVDVTLKRNNDGVCRKTTFCVRRFEMETKSYASAMLCRKKESRPLLSVGVPTLLFPLERAPPGQEKIILTIFALPLPESGQSNSVTFLIL
jgi:hypothetical protein